MAITIYSTRDMRTLRRKVLDDDPNARSVPRQSRDRYAIDGPRPGSKRRAILNNWLRESDRELDAAMREAFGVTVGRGRTSSGRSDDVQDDDRDDRDVSPNVDDESNW